MVGNNKGKNGKELPKGIGSSEEEDLMPKDYFDQSVTNPGFNIPPATPPASNPAPYSATEPEELPPESMQPLEDSAMNQPVQEGEMMSSDLMQELYASVGQRVEAERIAATQIDLDERDISHKASDILNDLESAIVTSLKDDMFINPTEEATIRDAMKRTGDTPEALVAIVGTHSYILYEKMKTNPSVAEAKKDVAAARALESTIYAAEMYSDRTFSDDNVYKIVKLQRLLKADISLIPELRDEAGNVLRKSLSERFKEFERVYYERGLNRKIYKLNNMESFDFTKEMKMQTSLVSVLESLQATVSNDMHIDDDELEYIQGVYNKAPLTKKELVSGMIFVLEKMTKFIENSDEYTNDERTEFKKYAVESAIKLKEKLVRKPSDESRESDIDAMIYNFGAKLNAPSCMIKEYKRAFTKAEYEGRFLNALSDILADWRVDPTEYMTFDNAAKAADMNFGECLEYASQIFLSKLREFDEEARTKAANLETRKTEAEVKSTITKKVATAIDALTTLVVYKLGKVPEKEDPLTKEYYELLGRLSYRVYKYDLSNQAFEGILKTPQGKEVVDRNMPEKCRERFKKEISPETSPGVTVESVIQQHIKDYNIMTALTAMDYVVAKQVLSERGFVEYNGQKVYKPFTNVAIVELMAGSGGKHCVVNVGTDNNSTIGLDQDSGFLGVHMGKSRRMKLDGSLDERVEKGIMLKIDPRKKEQEEIIFIHKSAIQEPAKKTARSDMPYVPLEINVDDTFGTLCEMYGLKSAALVRSPTPLFELECIRIFARENPLDVRVDPNKLKNAKAIYIPISRKERSMVDGTMYEGFAIIEPHWQGKFGKKNGTLMIPLRRASLVEGQSDYDLRKISERTIFASEAHLAATMNGTSPMYLYICANPDDKNYGAYLVFHDAEGTKPIRLNYMPYAILTGQPNSDLKIGDVRKHTPKQG